MRATRDQSEGNEDDRAGTGVWNLDPLIEGGFERKSINLIVGSSGSGKTIFALQFLLAGVRQGERCLYITFEEKKEEFYSNMAKFGWDLASLEEKGYFIFLEYTPEKVRTMLEEGGGTIESIVLKQKVSRIVIDSLTSFELLFSEDVEKRGAALELFSMLRKWDCTSLLTYGGSVSGKKKVSSRTFEFESDSIILLYFSRTRKERERYLEILKMRGTNHSRSIHPFSIGEGGISIGPEEFSGKVE